MFSPIRFILIVALVLAVASVNAAVAPEKRQVGSVIDNFTSSAGDTFNSLTSAAGSVASQATASIASVATNVVAHVTSIGGQAVTIISSEGGQVYTLATGAGGRVTSIGGSLYTVATAQATATNVASSASSNAPIFGTPALTAFITLTVGIVVGAYSVL